MAGARRVIGGGSPESGRAGRPGELLARQQVLDRDEPPPPLLGAFAIAEVAGLPALVYLETAHDGQTLEDPDVGTRMSVCFDALRTEALTGRASLSLIETAIEERWTT